MGRCLMLLLLALTSIAALGQEAYAVFTEADSTLTFYCDSLRSTRPDTTYSLNTGDNTPGWYVNREKVYNVVFDSTFIDARPTSTRGWFAGMNVLDSITGIQYLKTDSVTNMEGMFGACYSLTSLDLSGFNTSNVTDMCNMFGGCSSLTSLDLSSFSASNVTDMGFMFAGCSSLTTLNMSSFNTSNVESMSSMFSNCESLTSLDLRTFNTSKVKGTMSMFWHCKNLETIYVGNDWSTDSVTDSFEMFYGCTDLVGDHGTVYDVNHVDAAYAHLDGGPSNPGYLSVWREVYAIYTSDNTTLTFYNDSLRSTREGNSYLLNTGTTNPAWSTVAKNVTKVVFDTTFVAARPATTYSWFLGMNKLKSIDGIAYLNTSKVRDMRRMFYGCEKLPSLDLSSFNTSNVTNMWAMFADCDSLVSLDLSSFNTSNVTNMARMFSGCDTLTSLNLSSFNISNVIDMAGMFAGCRYLASINLNSFNTESVKYMGWMFDGCRSLTSLDLSRFNTANVVEMEYMFQGSETLASLNLSSFNTANVKEMAGMFAGCRSLSTLDLSKFNTRKVVDMAGMFSSCVSLTSLDLSHFHTSNVWNMDTMFAGCNHLETIYAGNSWRTDAVTKSDGMFYGCTSLVGGQGTVYDENHVDAAYAHIDGGSSDPGYLTGRVDSLLHGDVNGDGEVNITDVNCVINVILGAPDIYEGRADVNGDGEVNITDINAVIDIIL